jgi:hypothetical protein
VLRHVNTGAFEVYDFAGNQLTDAVSLGQVGSAVRRFSPDGLQRLIGDSGGPLSSQPANGSTSQVVHAMASFGDDAADTSTVIRLRRRHVTTDISDPRT